MNKEKGIICAILILIILCTGCHSSENGNRNYSSEFVNSTNINFEALDKYQEENLFYLCRIWGVVKYTHPNITKNKLDWDSELFKIIPNIIDEKDIEKRNQIIYNWLPSIDKYSASEVTPRSKEKIFAFTVNDWIAECDEIDSDTRAYLEKLVELKPTYNEHSYVKFEKSGLPIFETDNKYYDIKVKENDKGIMLLGLFRYWNQIYYFYPYRESIKTWNEEFFKALDEIKLCNSHEEYIRAMAHFVTSIKDSHAIFFDAFGVMDNLWGRYFADIEVINLSGNIVVTNPKLNDGFMAGDTIISIDGEKLDEKVSRCNHYISVSRAGNITSDYARFLLSTNAKTPQVEVIRKGELLSFTNEFVSKIGSNSNKNTTEKTSNYIDDKIYYINMSRLTPKGIDKIMQANGDADSMILDFRGSDLDPIAMVVLLEYFIDSEKPANKMISADPNRFGDFINLENQSLGNGAMKKLFKSEKNLLNRILIGMKLNNGFFNSVSKKYKKRDIYKGKVIALVDNTVMSSSETAVMALQNRSGLKVIGMPTAGANGDIVKVILPGGIETYFSSVDVKYNDDKVLQGHGIYLDKVVIPTTEGLSKNIDEILNDAIKHVQ